MNEKLYLDTLKKYQKWAKENKKHGSPDHRDGSLIRLIVLSATRPVSMIMRRRHLMTMRRFA